MAKAHPLAKFDSEEYNLAGHHAARPRGLAGDRESSLVLGRSAEYRTYKRRWFGLVQLSLMNIIVSWDASLVSSASSAAQYG